jgi:hypothetical protein
MSGESDIVKMMKTNVTVGGLTLLLDLLLLTVLVFGGVLPFAATVPES